MSRLIVKNLPNKVTVDTLKEVFGQKGEVTDVQLKHTKEGRFRNFGFIGFRTEEQAAAAQKYFNGTCIRSMKIQVEICANLGDEQKPRAWSKYAQDSTAFKKLHQSDEHNFPKQNIKKEKTKDKIKNLLKRHKDDPLFAEFIEAHVNSKTSWIKDVFEELSKSDTDDIDVNDKAYTETDNANTNQIKTNVESDTDRIAHEGISDLEYMKKLIKKADKQSSEDVEKDANKEEMLKKVRNRPLFHIKITGLPFKCKKKDIKEFFRPLVPFSIRLPLGKGKKLAGFCYVGFRSEKELKKALGKDKLFLGNHRIHIHQYEDKAKKAAEENEQTAVRKNQEKGNIEESIGESGSIFVRNLPYVVSEEEVTNLFQKYGPLAEVSMPIDKLTRQPKGFATITFMMPEHAVNAYTELDGTAFCGRMLHLLPAKTEKLDEDIGNDDLLSFKEKKAKKLKEQSKSSHNWNTLFLGTNAIADVVATNYNTSKEQLLNDNNKNTSAAVRLALGETELVSETRAFLENNGVYLDAFNKPPKARSKTCILVKNLPAKTEQSEVKELFEKHGHIARFLMPQHGITALVDFIEPFEAKKAFTKLAYSMFKASPLYLEWAPENVFAKSSSSINKDFNTGKQLTENIENSETETPKQVVNKEVAEMDTTKIDLEPESDTSLFVKNLNFKTHETALKKHFSECGEIYSVTIAKKKDPKNPGQFLSMGYGFVQFYRKHDANEALKALQSSSLDGKTLELKRSERGNSNEVKTSKKTSKETVQNGTKILVRNVPFQANRKELDEIFRAFGEIKTLRLPKKLTQGSDQHRGFAFVDYHSKSDAKSAFDALCQSTHLYGRRLVLEWADESGDTEDVNVLRKRTASTYAAKTSEGKKSRKAVVDVETFVEGEI